MASRISDNLWFLHACPLILCFVSIPFQSCCFFASSAFWSQNVVSPSLCYVILYPASSCPPFLLQVRYTQLVRKKKRKLVGRSVGGGWRGVGSMSEGRLGARGGSRRSGYAFAHQEGFGELITSGKNMRLSSLALASFASRHSSSWIETLRRKKHAHTHTPPSTSGDCSPAPSCFSGSVPPLSNSSSVLGGSQDTPIEEETAAAQDQNTVLTSSTQTPSTSEASAQPFNTCTFTPTTGRPHGGDSPGGWTVTLGTVQVSCFT